MNPRKNNRALQAYIGIGSTSLKNAKYSSIVPLPTIAGFSHKRYAGDAGNAFSGTFIDHSAFELESALMSLGSTVQSRSIMFQYGYDMTSEGMSRVHYGYIYDYSPTIVGNIVQLEIYSVGRAEVDSAGVSINSWSNYTNGFGKDPIGPSGRASYLDTIGGGYSQERVFRPSDTVERICNTMGWKIGEVTPTQQISSVGVGIYDIQTDNPITYINKVLSPISVATSGAGDYKFWVDHDNRGNVVAYYKPSITKATPDNTYTHTMDHSGSYNYNHRDSVIEQWSPVVSGGALMAYGGANTNASSFNEATNEDYYYEATLETSNLPRDAARQWMPQSENVSASVKFSSSSLDKIDRKVENHWQRVQNLQYVVNAKILGDPSRKVMETLDFNIYSGGRLHHTSGRYLVTGVEDQFNVSGFYTNLELLKNSAYQGPSSASSGSGGTGSKVNKKISMDRNLIEIERK